MKLAAHAKINVSLHITGTLPSGLHEIETLMIPLALHDDVILEPADEIVVDGMDIPLKDNLAYRAAMLLRNETKTTYGARISLLKRIPAGAGLGGGSSDAAAVLRGLNELWGLGMNNDELRVLALRLGADVPFFIDSIPARARGIGERLIPEDFPDCHVLLALPAFSVSTAWAYSAYDQQPARDAHNDFFPIIARTRPEIISIRDELIAKGAKLATLTGTGSALFGLFESEERAKSAALALPCASILTRTLRKT